MSSLLDREVSMALPKAPRLSLIRRAGVMSMLAAFLVVLGAVGATNFVVRVGGLLEVVENPDWLFGFVSGLVEPKLESPIAVAFIHVDDSAYSEWDGPAFIPRRHLASLVTRLRRAEAEVIFLDFDLSVGDASREEDPLYKAIEGWTDEGPLLLLAAPVEPTHEIANAAEEDLRPRWVLKRNLYEELVAENPHIAWISVVADYVNGRLAEFAPWIVVCGPSMRRAIPSLPIILGHYQQGGMDQLRDFDEQLRELSAGSCDDEEEALVVGNAMGVAPRMTIPFSFQWDPGRLQVGPRVTGVTEPVENGEVVGEQPVIYVVSALSVLGATANDLRRLVEGRVAIVGASHSESGDIHETPWMPMPGAWIQTNLAVHSVELLASAEGSATIVAVGLFLVVIAYWMVLEPFVAFVSTVATLIGVTAMVARYDGAAAAIESISFAVVLLVWWKIVAMMLEFLQKIGGKRGVRWSAFFSSTARLWYRWFQLRRK